MKAVGFLRCAELSEPDALLDLELPEPVPGHGDLLVAVEAVGMNPLDTKVRRLQPPPEGQARVLGWDVAGTVLATDPAVDGFQPGDRVWYAGALHRAGAASERHVVDHRLVSRRPASWDAAQCAALPLTAITAWELLFDRLGVTATSTGALLVTGAAGGVGSMLIQLARALTGLTVVATASRPETRDWASGLGAHHVIDHHEDLLAAWQALGLGEAPWVASLTATDRHAPALSALMAPQGRLALIDDPQQLDIRLFKRKSISLHWEYMFTRSLFDTTDVARQGAILAEVAALAEAGRLRSTLHTRGGPITANAMRAAQACLERGEAIGKIVLVDF